MRNLDGEMGLGVVINSFLAYCFPAPAIFASMRSQKYVYDIIDRPSFRSPLKGNKWVFVYVEENLR